MRIDNGVIRWGDNGRTGENRWREAVVRERPADRYVGDIQAGDVDGSGAKESLEDGEEDGVEHRSGSSLSESLSLRRSFLDMRTRGRMEPLGRQR